MSASLLQTDDQPMSTSRETTEDDAQFHPGFYALYLQRYTRPPHPFGVNVFLSSSTSTSGELYEWLWNTALPEPFAETRLLVSETEQLLHEHLRHFDVRLSSDDRQRFIHALFTEGWLEIVYEALGVGICLLRLLIHPLRRTAVPYASPDLRIDQFILGAAYRSLNRVVSEQSGLLQKGQVNEEGSAQLTFAELGSRDKRYLFDPRNVLAKLVHMPRRKRAAGGDRAIDGVLFALQRLGLVEFMGPAHDALRVIRLHDSDLPEAQAVAKWRNEYSKAEVDTETVAPEAPTATIPTPVESDESVEASPLMLKLVIELTHSPSPEGQAFLLDLAHAQEEEEALRRNGHPLDEILLDDEDMEQLHARLDRFAADPDALAWYACDDAPAAELVAPEEDTVAATSEPSFIEPTALGRLRDQHDELILRNAAKRDEEERLRQQAQGWRTQSTELLHQADQLRAKQAALLAELSACQTKLAQLEAIDQRIRDLQIRREYLQASRYTATHNHPPPFSQPTQSDPSP